jgi:hypothetical protein
MKIRNPSFLKKCRKKQILYKKTALCISLKIYNIPFSTILGFFRVARLAMCNIRECSESLIVFDDANIFPNEQF